MVTAVLMAHSRQNSPWHRGVCDIARSTWHFVKPVPSTSEAAFPLRGRGKFIRQDSRLAQHPRVSQLVIPPLPFLLRGRLLFCTQTPHSRSLHNAEQKNRPVLWLNRSALRQKLTQRPAESCAPALQSSPASQWRDTAETGLERYRTLQTATATRFGKRSIASPRKGTSSTATAVTNAATSPQNTRFQY